MHINLAKWPKSTNLYGGVAVQLVVHQRGQQLLPRDAEQHLHLEPVAAIPPRTDDLIEESLHIALVVGGELDVVPTFEQDPGELQHALLHLPPVLQRQLTRLLVDADHQPNADPPRQALQIRLGPVQAGLDHAAEVLVAGLTLIDSAARLAEEPSGFWNLSTLKEPYRVEGKKTMGLEIAEQFGWKLPDWILYPTGGGTGIVGMHKAFAELRQLGLVGERMPRLVSVQSDGCAPIVRAFEQGLDHAPPWENPESSIWGLRVPQAIGDFLVLQALRESGGCAIAVPEESAQPAALELQRQEGLITGPEGGAAMVALEKLIASGAMSKGEVVVVFQTGHPGNYAVA